MPAASVIRRLGKFAGWRHQAPAPPAVRPANRRRAPRALAWGFAAVVILQLGLGLASELYPRIRDPLYGDKLVKLQRRLRAADHPATVVMLGSSRTGLAFHGKRAEAYLAPQLGRPVVAFNYGIPASGPVTHLVYLKRLLNDGVTPDLLVLEILPSMFADLPGAPIEQNWFFADRLKYAEQETVIRHGFPAGTTHERWRKSFLIPWYTLRFQVLTRFVPSWLPWQVRFDWSRGADECGWGTSVHQTATPAEHAAGLARVRAEYAAILADLRPGGPAAGALRELLAVCRERGVPVRLVLMPEGTEFRALYPPHVLVRVRAFLAPISAEYDAPLTDAREWLPDGAFYDSHHMFAVGAEAFTDRLSREVIAPSLRETK
jgi:hypothetical protein